MGNAAIDTSFLLKMCNYFKSLLLFLFAKNGFEFSVMIIFIIFFKPTNSIMEKDTKSKNDKYSNVKFV